MVGYNFTQDVIQNAEDNKSMEVQFTLAADSKGGSDDNIRVLLEPT
jgi:hypothetical protein